MDDGGAYYILCRGLRITPGQVSVFAVDVLLIWDSGSKTPELSARDVLAG
jgi:hypothetical protein